jgi:hypothetical protein
VIPLSPNECTLDQAQSRLPVRWKGALLVETFTTYARVRWLLARNDLPTALGRLRQLEGAPATEVDELLTCAVGYRLGEVAARALRPLPADSRCLVRSLVLTRMMARRGIPTTLIIGAQTESGFQAHAWVERRGRPLLSPGSDYGRLVEL